VDSFLGAVADRDDHWWVRASTSVALALLLVGITVPALNAGLPNLVDLPGMLGIPLLVLAAFAFVALPFLRGPASRLGAALALVTYPLVLYNPFNSEFLPHRTVVFLGIAFAILAGAAAGSLQRWIARSWTALAARRTSRASPTSRPRFAAVFVPALLVALALGIPVYASTPDSYAGGWYRLYSACEIAGFQDIAAKVDQDPHAIVIAGDWQAKLVLSALASNSTRIWNKPDFFHVDEPQQLFLESASRTGLAIYVVHDRYLMQEHPDSDVRFLKEGNWQPLGPWCTDANILLPLRAYVEEPLGA
jgi:hypothetical protein